MKLPNRSVKNFYDWGDKKFQQYPDANIYIHKCASKHEMDALEILLIEKYKPDLNVTAKTDNALTVSIGDDLEWIDYKTFKKQEVSQNNCT